MTWPGFVPHVTCGRIAAPSISKTSSNLAPGSVASARHSSIAASKSLPFGANGRPSINAKVDIVGSDHPGARAGLDGHVANRHPALHRERAKDITAVLDDIADSATRSDPSDDRKHDVLRAHTLLEFAVHLDRHRLWSALTQRLGREHVFDLRGADSERERSESPVRRGMAVAAHDRHPRLGEAELGSDDVDDPLVRVPHRVLGHAEFGAVLRQHLKLFPRGRVGNRLVDVDRRDVVVSGREREFRTPHPPSRKAKTLERLRGRHFVHEMKVDVEQICRRRRGPADDDVPLPDFLGQGGRHRYPILSTPTTL